MSKSQNQNSEPVCSATNEASDKFTKFEGMQTEDSEMEDSQVQTENSDTKDSQQISSLPQMSKSQNQNSEPVCSTTNEASDKFTKFEGMQIENTEMEDSQNVSSKLDDQSPSKNSFALN